MVIKLFQPNNALKKINRYCPIMLAKVYLFMSSSCFAAKTETYSWSTSNFSALCRTDTKNSVESDSWRHAWTIKTSPKRRVGLWWLLDIITKEFATHWRFVLGNHARSVITKQTQVKSTRKLIRLHCMHTTFAYHIFLSALKCDHKSFWYSFIIGSCGEYVSHQCYH